MLAAIVPAEPWHVEAVALNARPADEAELWAIARATPAQCLRYGLRTSAFAYTGLLDGVPVCVFGASPFSILSGIGVPWMVGTTHLDSHRAQRELLRHARPCLDAMSHSFPTLGNVVDARNTAAIRWIRWLGFTLGEPMPMGPDKLPFIPFLLERKQEHSDV